MKGRDREWDGKGNREGGKGGVRFAEEGRGLVGKEGEERKIGDYFIVVTVQERSYLRFYVRRYMRYIICKIT